MRTYFQPSTVLQPTQEMSATVCIPVISNRSSLGPTVRLTLQACAVREPGCRLREQWGPAAGQAVRCFAQVGAPVLALESLRTAHV